MRPWRALLAAALLGVGFGACSDAAPKPDEPLACQGGTLTAELESVDAAEVRVHLEGQSRNAEIAREDLGRYLGAMWQTTVEVSDALPDYSSPYTVWASTSPKARALAGDPGDGYVLRRVAGANGDIVVVHASSEDTLVAGVYALLEEMGARFFHPLDEVIPSFDGARLPAKLDIARRPAFRVRGIQLHLLHPTEYFRAFNVAGNENLAVARRFVDWLAKTGQNHLQWWVLDTLDFPSWIPHAKQIIDYAHARGMTVGAVAHLWGGASLQNGYDLVTSEANWQAEMESQLDGLMVLPFDLVEVGLGEFIGGDPQLTVDWLNHGTAYLADNYGVDFSASIHVGNYPDLWIDYQGQETFYYHLPGYADKRLINDVHTVFFFDLYRDRGMYAHDNFHLQREFLLQELSEDPPRRMRYIPESAYWVTADVDVPVFLPEYSYARWVDISGLYADLRDAGLPPLEGHVMFSSGHEWGYWMTDYLAARMMWEPEEPYRHFLDHYAAAYGSCAPRVADDLERLVQLQNQYLFDELLVSYLSGEDAQDDLGALAGITTHPPRVPFEIVHAMTDEERGAFQQRVVQRLEQLASELAALETRFAEVCQGVSAPLESWCGELWDGVAVTRLRLTHSALLYRAVLEQSSARLERARAIRTEAAAVIARREQHYRFPLPELVDTWKNPTIYNFGYLRQAHLTCYWERQEKQAEWVIELGSTPAIANLPSCL